MTKIQVPAGMLGAVEMYVNSQDGRGYAMPILEAALQWLSEHPIVPTDEQVASMAGRNSSLHWGWDTDWREHICDWLIAWQRRMFLAEPEIPEEVKDLLSPTCQNLWEPSKKEYDAAVLEAFRRGRNSK